MWTNLLFISHTNLVLWVALEERLWVIILYIKKGLSAVEHKWAEQFVHLDFFFSLWKILAWWRH